MLESVISSEKVASLWSISFSRLNPQDSYLFPSLCPCLLQPCPHLTGATLKIWNNNRIFTAGLSPSVQLGSLRAFVSQNLFLSYFLLLGSRDRWLFNRYFPFAVIKAFLHPQRSNSLDYGVFFVLVSHRQVHWDGASFCDHIFIYLAKIL